jgi:hypothetical protein
MFSVPPAATTDESPALIDWAAAATARSPEPHTMLMVIAVLSMGRPALTMTCLATFCPRPACSTQPSTASSTSPGATPARSIAATTAVFPSSTALTPERAPLKLPMAVLAAPTMKMSFI